jgi:hypothetical protein
MREVVHLPEAPDSRVDVYGNLDGPPVTEPALTDMWSGFLFGELELFGVMPMDYGTPRGLTETTPVG